MDSYDVQFNKNSERKRKKTTKMILVVLLVLLLITAGIITLLRKPFLFIQTVTIMGTEALDPILIQERTDQYLGQMKAYVIPRKNILVFSKQHFTNWLMRQFPAIRDMSVVFDQEKNMTITITERKPKALWCQQQDCFFIGYDGIIYRKAPQFSDGIFLKIQGEPVENPLGYSIENLASIGTLMETVELLALNNTNVSKIELGNPHKFFVYTLAGYSTNFSSYILYNNQDENRSLNILLDLLMTDTVFQENLKQYAGKLEYIDLTIPEKIYYRFSNTPTPQLPQINE
jgi:hypothetical protein